MIVSDHRRFIQYSLHCNITSVAIASPFFFFFFAHLHVAKNISFKLGGRWIGGQIDLGKDKSIVKNIANDIVTAFEFGKVECLSFLLGNDAAADGHPRIPNVGSPFAPVITVSPFTSFIAVSPATIVSSSSSSVSCSVAVTASSSFIIIIIIIIIIILIAVPASSRDFFIAIVIVIVTIVVVVVVAIVIVAVVATVLASHFFGRGRTRRRALVSVQTENHFCVGNGIVRLGDAHQQRPLELVGRKGAKLGGKGYLVHTRLPTGGPRARESVCQLSRKRVGKM